MKATRRRILIGAAAVVSSTIGDAATAQLLKSGPSTPRTQRSIPPDRPARAAELATLTLVNDEASVAPAGTPTQSFGWIFKDGDIAPGKAPQFQVRGIDQPFSAAVPAMRRYYPSGSLMYCYFSIRKTFAIPAGASETVQILSGGTWPSSSGRSLNSDVYPQNLAISLPAAPVPGANLSGTWGAWLANDGNLISSGAMAPALDMDGDAGTRWRLYTHCSETRGGAKHGQMAFVWYVWALNYFNATSTVFGGIRWSGAVCQPWYNLSGEGTTVPSKNNRAFARPNYAAPASGPSWTANGISATNMGFRGYDGKPILPISASRTATDGNGVGVLTTRSPNNYWLGGSNGDVLGCHFTSITGTLPFNSETVYFLITGKSATDLYVCSTTRCEGSSVINLASYTGTCTINPIVCVPQFTKLFFRDDYGRDLFFPGSGEMIADPSVRAQIDRKYWMSTKLIPPYDKTLSSIPNGGSITDAKFNAPWNPCTHGATNRDQDGSTGDDPIIGILPNVAGIDFYNQSLRSNRAIRCTAMAAAWQPEHFLDSSTNSLVNVSNTKYTGLPTPLDDSIAWGIYSQGFKLPPSGAWGFGFTSVASTEHKPRFSPWAYLTTGELLFYDLMMENAVGVLLGYEAPRRNTTTPFTRKGVSLAMDIEYRSIAWRFADVQWAALLCGYDPSNPTALGIDGTQLSKWCVDAAAQDLAYYKDCLDPVNNYYGVQTRYITGRALWSPKFDYGGNRSGNFLCNAPEWQFAFIVYGFCVAAARGDANALYCLNTASVRWNYISKAYGLWHPTAYYVTWGPAEANHTGQPLFGSDRDWVVIPNYASFTWVPNTHGGRAFKITGWNNGWTPRDGDIFMLGAPGAAGAPNSQGLYMRDWDGEGNFNLATTPGGTALTITNSSRGNYVDSTGQQISSRPKTDWAAHNPPHALGLSSLLQIRAACLWAKAHGGANFQPILDDFDFRLRNTSGGPYSPVQKEPSTAFSDVRYAYQDHF